MGARDADSAGLTCREAIGLLADYLESALSEQEIRELEEHLAGCGPCQAYLNTYRRTKDLTGKAERVAMPEELKNRLRTFLLRALSKDG
jgi:anti-sigma factor RsiW